MTVEELRARLAEYMERDVTLRPPLIAVEVRMKPTYDASCRYDVLLIDEEGGETRPHKKCGIIWKNLHL